MIKNLLGTAFSRVIIALLNLVIVILNARYFGAEGLGTVGLIMLAITIILVVNNIIGGGALIYLAPRESNRWLFTMGYLWALLTVLAFFGAQQIYPLVPVEFQWDVMLLSLLYSFAFVNLNLLLGREKIRIFNTLNAVQMVILFLVLYYLLVWKGRTDVHAFVQSLYWAYGFVFLMSLIFVLPLVTRGRGGDAKAIFLKIIRLGAMNQLAYIAQTLNYRFNYYLLDFFTGRPGLGMFHFGNQLSEGTWIVGRSAATVQYMRISNSEDKEYARRLTLGLAKFTFLGTLILIILLILIPETVYTWVGKDFHSTRPVILCLSTGILSNAVSMMFSHYFSGLGKPKYNAIGSLIGLVITVVFGFLLIPSHGILGAGIAASLAYTAAMVYQMLVFFRHSGSHWGDLIIRKADWQLLVSEIRSFLQKKL